VLSGEAHEKTRVEYRIASFPTVRDVKGRLIFYSGMRQNNEVEDIRINLEISGSYCGEHENGCLLGCCVVYFVRSLTTF
jgi:hypothetical protein